MRLMENIYTSVNFFRDFGANVLSEKNTLKNRKRLLSDNYTGEQGPGPMFLYPKFDFWRIFEEDPLLKNFQEFRYV